MLKKNNLQYLIIVVLGVLLVATILVSLKAGNKGDKLVLLASEAQALQGENQDLKDNLVATSSLTRIAKVASASGMVVPENFLYISSSVASLP